MSNEKIQYLTQTGFDELIAEKKILKDKTIPDIATKIDEAKQQGDLSENAEYHQAKEEMAWAQGRLLEIDYILENAKILEKTQNTEEVNVGSTVSFTNKDNQEKKYTIVGPPEADPPNGRISNESPIGEAFLGKKLGETVTVKTPVGEQEYKIVEIS